MAATSGVPAGARRGAQLPLLRLGKHTGQLLAELLGFGEGETAGPSRSPSFAIDNPLYVK